MAYRDHPLTKYMDEYVIQGRYDGRTQWDDLCSETNPKEAMARYRDYQDNDSHADELRWIIRRIPNEDYGRFKVGQNVKIAPFCDSFMRGFTYGKVTKVGRKYITVAWTMNRTIVKRFPAELLEPEQEWESQYR